MAPSSTLNQELGPFLTPHLVEFWKTLKQEITTISKEYNDLLLKIRALDTKLGPYKKRHSTQSKKVELMIERRKKLHEEMRELEWKFSTRERILVSLDATMDAAILSYAQASCHAFMSQLHSTLPRELRDMVYQYVLDDATLDLIGTQVRDQISLQCCVELPCETKVVLPHIVDPTFMPSSISTEVLQVAAQLYSHRPKSIIKTGNIRSLLNAKALHLEVPASEYFRDIVVRLDFSETLRRWRSKNGSTSGFQTYVQDLLLAIPVRRDRILTIEVGKVRLTPSEEEICRRSIEPVVEEVQKQEFRDVRVRWCMRQFTADGDDETDEGSS